MSWEQLAPQTIQRLSNDLQISPQVAAGIVGQLGYESAGLQSINEYKPVVPGSRGGFGWAQWTGPRRRQFESWAQQNNMDVADPEANYQFLVYELTQTPEKRVLDKIRGIEDPVEAGKVFTDTFLRPGVPAYDKRASWVEKAVNLMVPTAQAQTQQGGNVEGFTLEQLHKGLQRAQAAGNQEAVAEIQQLIQAQQPQATPETQAAPQFSMEQLQQGLQRAQAAGNQEAVQEIQGLISQMQQPAQEAPQAPQERSTGEELMRQGELFLRNLGEGAEQAFTFPVRAVGEAIATGAGQLGFPEAAQTISETVGIRTPTVAGGVADVAGLAKPETPIEKAVSMGQQAMSGAAVGNVANTLARNTPQMTRQLSSVLFPQATTGKELATFGAVGTGMEAAPMETAAGMAGITTLAGLTALAAGGRGRAALNTRSAERGIMQSAGGSPSRAATDSEIIKKINTEYNAGLRTVDGKLKPLSAQELNQKVAGSYIREAQKAVRELPNDYPRKAEYMTALGSGRGLSTQEINALRTDAVGNAVADAIEQAQRSQVLTQAVAAAGGLPAAAARAGVDAAPVAIAATTGIPAYIPQGFTAAIKNRLGGRIGRAEAGERLVGEALVKGADNVLAKTGPSEATSGIKTIQQIAKEASKAQAAKQATKQQDIAIARAEAAARKEAEAAAKKQQELRQGLADIQSKDPTYLLGLSSRTGTPRNQAEMAEFSSVIRNQMEAREALAALQRGETLSPELAKSLADLKARDPGYLLGMSSPFGAPRSPKQMTEFSKLLKSDMEQRYKKAIPKDSTPEEIALVQRNSVENWSQGKTGSGGIQGTFTKYTGLKDQELVDVLEELAQRKPDFAPFVQSVRESGRVPNSQVLGMMQDEAIRIALEKGLNVTPQALKQSAQMSGVTGVSGIANEFYKRASSIVSGLDDDAIQMVVNRTASASGEPIANPRAYATGTIAKILNDRAQNRELDAAAQTLIQSLGL